MAVLDFGNLADAVSIYNIHTFSDKEVSASYNNYDEAYGEALLKTIRDRLSRDDKEDWVVFTQQRLLTSYFGLVKRGCTPTAWYIENDFTLYLRYVRPEVLATVYVSF